MQNPIITIFLTDQLFKSYSTLKLFYPLCNTEETQSLFSSTFTNFIRRNLVKENLKKVKMFRM